MIKQVFRTACATLKAVLCVLGIAAGVYCVRSAFTGEVLGVSFGPKLLNLSELSAVSNAYDVKTTLQLIISLMVGGLLLILVSALGLLSLPGRPGGEGGMKAAPENAVNVPAQTPQAAGAVTNHILHWHKLAREGLLTEEEFEEKIKQILK